MMEESSDEQPEIISHEEAQLAEKEAAQTAAATPQKTGVGPSNVAAPSPLPSFLATSSPTPTSGSTQVKASPSPVPQKQVSSITTPSVKGPIISAAVASPAPGGTTAPGHMETPYEASSSIPVSDDSPGPMPQSGGGLFSWISGNSLVSKVMEKTKNSMESVITTLDPGMKEIIRSGGDINIVVTSTKESKLGAVREAFQQVFGRATITGMESQATTAAQPVGCTAGLKGAEERIQNLRQKSSLSGDQPIVSVEGFIMELLPDRWYEMSCLVLQDPSHRIDLQTFSQPTPIPAEFVLSAQDQTPSTYPLRWSGLAVTIGQVIETAQPHIGHTDWQSVLVGVSRREALLLAARGLAYMYQQRLPTSFIS
ncbi:protein PRRC1-A-like [Haliotis rufescens]|uniref:protein PRRC1-A-like n=1 Tax=Haliotis rufescens TaxID=6454 RepID=UPI00201E9698|nr:protein PRRC1-A-like [Haliotis rufescens]XP_046368787.2 protein PRRC1-A-like [Haliotis rufescens]